MNAVCVFDPSSTTNKRKISGTITFHQCAPNYLTVVTFSLKGLPPNTIRGCHIHEAGDLTEGCKTACAHFNPFKQAHGYIFNTPEERHAGDLVNNITSDAKGEFNFSYYDNLVDLSGPNSVIGRSIIIHDQPDDLGIYRNEHNERGKASGTTGNAGERIACAIIGISHKDYHPSV